MNREVTLFRGAPADPDGGTDRSSLPTDLLDQAAARLRVLALLYAFVFFMAGFFPMLVTAQNRALLFSTFVQWGPATVAIALALAVAGLVRSRRLSRSGVSTLGLTFEIASSYCIAVAELIDARGYAPHEMMLSGPGLSWVGVWVLLFTIVVPASPRRALLASLASVSAIPVTQLVLASQNLTRHRPEPLEFFFGLVMPYLLVVCMAYVGARVIYALGSEIKRARELGSYHLEEKLGEGGMGEVWRARHRLLARPAAIKLMRRRAPGPGGMPDALVHRFEREAQAIASLRSPHTVTLFDFGVAQDGVFYYVMELLDGLDTDRLVRRFGPLPASRVVHLLRQVCHSLGEADANRLVHRDIKPANIFLCRYGEDYDFVKVLDFGIVKATTEAPDARPAPNLTGEQAVNGTPAFMAPEQILGGTIDGRTDLYATGCVAYWLLTGRLVFEADTAMGYLMHHARTPALPPSTRTELPVPPALDELVLACLEKDPARRPASARDLARRLDQIALAAPWTDADARAWWERVRP
ncbi:MAG TPA: serine/threonine-protein kinase [Gemmatimonadales bacterium]|nr:serine/threonine-protein kinase [Gemmatimonadales bacterium]